MALTDKERDELLAKISRKIDSSAVLNGGFDKLVIVVDSIKQRQSEQSDKLDQINTRLYEPKEGLFSRVQQLENDMSNVGDKIDANTKEDTDHREKVEKYFEKIESIKKTTEETQLATKRLQRIGGEDLQEIEKTVELNKKLSTLYWGMVAVALSGFANIIWQLVTRR